MIQHPAILFLAWKAVNNAELHYIIQSTQKYGIYATELFRDMRRDNSAVNNAELHYNKAHKNTEYNDSRLKKIPG